MSKFYYPIFWEINSTRSTIFFISQKRTRVRSKFSIFKISHPIFDPLELDSAVNSVHWVALGTEIRQINDY